MLNSNTITLRHRNPDRKYSIEGLCESFMREVMQALKQNTSIDNIRQMLDEFLREECIHYGEIFAKVMKNVGYKDRKIKEESRSYGYRAKHLSIDKKGVLFSRPYTIHCQATKTLPNLEISIIETINHEEYGQSVYLEIRDIKIVP